jgi:hypothetical protein
MKSALASSRGGLLSRELSVDEVIELLKREA